MRRREFISLIGGVSVARPFAARAQPTKIPRIGVLSPSRSEDASPNRVTLQAFVTGMRELGYVDGQNITIERTLSEANADRLREAVAEMVKHNVDVIVTLSSTAARPPSKPPLSFRLLLSPWPILLMMNWLPVLRGQAGTLQGRVFLARN